MTEFKRITIFVMHNDDSTDYDWVSTWIIKWKSQFKLTVHNYSTGGWEHSWDFEVIKEAIDEVPPDYLCYSEWSNPVLFKK